MSIRGRLLTLAVGGVIPLLIVGLTVLWSVWDAKEQQLNEGLEQQGELAAVVFDRWLDAQRQPLVTIASYPAEHLSNTAALEADLRAAMARRPHWLDLRVVDASGRVVAMSPAGAESLPTGLAERLLGVTRSGLPDVETDWTRGEGGYLLAVAVPVEGGGACIARIDGAALKEPLQGITLPDRALVTLLDKQHRIIYRSQTPESALGLDLSGVDKLSAINDRNTAVVVVRSTLDGVERIYGLARVGATGYVVMVGIPSEILYASAWRQLTGYAVVGLIVVFCTMTGALLIARSITRPLRLLNFAAEQFGEGNFSARAPSEGRDGVSRLGMSFNSMAERLEKREARLAELDSLKSEFVSSVSHELRTPLTTIKTLTRLLQRGGQTGEEQREYLETIAAECDRQIDLVLNLLDLSRIEAGAFKVSRTRVDVEETIRACVRIEKHAAEARGLRLEAESIPREMPPILTDSGALRRVLCSLIENAIKYTPEGGHITVGTYRQGEEEVAITIGDTGCGILPEDIPHVFEKFYRGRPSAASLVETADYNEASGVGLGLYLAHSIVEQLGGRIAVENRAPRGAVFTIYLPVWSGNDEGQERQTLIREKHDAEAFARG